MKRLLSGLLSLVMVFSLTPSTIAFADDETTDITPQSEENGTTGTNEEETTNVGTTTSSGVEMGGTNGQNGGAETTSQTEENSGSVDLNTMSSDELYEYLLNVDDMDALYEEYPNLNDLISKLSEDQQNQLAKKFGNSEEDVELIDNNDNTISPSSDVVNITKGGEYTVKGGTYTNEASAIKINTSEQVILNIKGNIEYNGSGGFIALNQSSGDLIINAKQEDGTDWTINSWSGIDVESGKTATFNGGKYDNCPITASSTSTVFFDGCTFHESDITATNITMKNCIIDTTDSLYSVVQVENGGNLKLEGESDFNCNPSTLPNYDIILNEGATVTLKEGFSNKNGDKLKIYLVSEPEENGYYQVTKDTSDKMVDKITSSQGYCVINKDDGMYFWNHKHSYGDPEVNEKNKDLLIKKCEECDRYETLATLNAEDVGYTGNDYKAEVKLSEGSSISDIEYKYEEKQKDGTYKNVDSARSVGQYKVIASFKYDSKPYELEKDFEITNTITPSQTITIKDGGEYTVVGGMYNLGYDDKIIVDTSEEVTLYIKGELDLGQYVGIRINSNSGAVTINGTKNDDGLDSAIKFYGMSGFYCESQNPVTFNNIRLRGGISNNTQGKLIFNNCNFGYNKSYISIDAVDMEINNCTFDSDSGIVIRDNGNVKFKGKNTFDNSSSTYDVYLLGDSTITLDKSYTTNDNYELKVRLSSSLANDKKRKITVDTSKDMMDMITSSEGYYAIYKDGDIYFWNHEHTLDTVPTVMGNLLVKKCTTDGCDYYETLATLKATDSSFTSKDYSGADVEVATDYEDIIGIGEKQYKEKGSKEEYSTTAPTQVGDYIVSVDVTYNNKTYTLTKEFKITNTISPSDITDTVTITKGGTYNIEGGTFSSPIVIDTFGDVTLCIKGNLDFKYSSGCDIEIKSDSGAVTINGTKNDDGSNSAINFNVMPGFSNDSQKTVTFNDVRLHGKIYSSGELVFNNCNIDYDNDYTFIYTTYMEFSNCTFGSKRDICVANNGNVKLKGQNIFDDSANGYDIDLSNDSMITLDTSFTTNDNYKLKVKLSSSLTDEGQQQITTTGTSKDMLNNIESTDGYTAVYKDKSIYFWKHTHNWKWNIDGNVLSEKCDNEQDSKVDCKYYNSPLTTTLIADGGTYNGNEYTARCENNNSDTVTVYGITYYKNGELLDSAPRDAGTYEAKIDAVYNDNGSVVSNQLVKEFTIKKADQTATVIMSDYVYGGTVSTPTISDVKEDAGATYYYSKDNKNTDGTEWKDIGKKTLTPGTYYMYAVVDETDNYNSYTTDPVKFTVNSGTLSDIVAKNVEKTYDGNSYGITVDLGDFKDATVKYGTTEGTYDLTTSPTYKNAGTYTVYYQVTLDGYEPYYGSATVTINRKRIEVKPNVKDKVYDGTRDAEVCATVVPESDLIAGDSITISGLTGHFREKWPDGNQNPIRVEIETDNVQYSGTGVENYEIYLKTARAKILPRTVELKWDTTEFTYDGNEHTVTAEVSNVLSGDKVNLTYEGNTETAAGTYIAKVSLDNSDYALPENAEITWKISYLESGKAVVSGSKNDNDWYSSSVTIIPDSGYMISEDGKEWKDVLSYGDDGKHSVSYSLKQIETGFITDQKTEQVNVDTTAPTGEIKIRENSFKTFLNKISFNYFFKDTVDVSITGNDDVSGVSKVEYQKVAKDASYNEKSWVTGNALSMKSNDKSVIYARITDYAGNMTIINSEGVVVYTDATTTSKETFDKSVGSDVTTNVSVNGNTIASVTNGSETIDQSAYEVNEDKLVLKGAYLSTLDVGTYTFTVNYNPNGETYTSDSKGDAPSTSVIQLSVTDKMEVSAEGYSGSYDGNSHGITVNVSKPSEGAKISYGTKDKDGKISYSETPVTYKDAGKYTVYYKVTVDNYKDVEGSADINIEPKSVIVSATSTSKVYGDKDPDLTYTISDVDTLSGIKVNRETGEDVGTYKISVSVDSNPNYSVKTVDGTFTISPKSISDAAVTLGSALIYNGSEQTQKVKSVVVDGMDVTYSVSGNKATDVGGHTLTVTGTGNFTGSVSVDYVVVPTKASQMKVNSDGKISYGKGIITVDGSVLNSKTDFIAMLIKDGSISSGELSSIYSGNELSISLKITDVSNVLDDSVKSSMKVSGFTLGNQFLDISLYKGEEKIHTTSGKVKITIDVPDELINKDSSVKRTYYVIRNHNGEVSSIDGTFNEKDQTFTFETDKFSAYALAYKDVTTKQSETKKDTTNKSDSKKEPKKDSKKSTNTGVQSNIGLCITLVIVSMIGLVILVRKKRFE